MTTLVEQSEAQSTGYVMSTLSKESYRYELNTPHTLAKTELLNPKNAGA